MALPSPAIPFADIARWMTEHPHHVIVSLFLHAEDLAALQRAVESKAPSGAHALAANGIGLYWGRDVWRGTVRIVAHEVPSVDDIVAAMDAIRSRTP